MRKTAPFRETLPLARAIEKIVGRHGRRHPATQVFQALRMEVNDELGALEEGLRVLTARLESRRAHRGHHFSLPGGSDREEFLSRSQPRMAGSAGVAGAATQSGLRSQLITSKPVEPGEEEQRINPTVAQRKVARGRKDLNEPLPSKKLQYCQRRFAGALDCDDGVSGGDRIEFTFI